MRKTIVGAVFASALAATGCTTAERAAPAASSSPQGPTPEQIAAREVKPGFVGLQKIGAWTLVCGKAPDKSPPPPANGKPIQSQVIQKGGQQLLDIQIHVPPRPCDVRDVFEDADQPDGETAATFKLRGAYGVLSMIFHARADHFPVRPIHPNKGPDGNSPPAELASLTYDGKTITSPMMTCGLKFCIAAIEIRPEDESGLLAAKDIAIQLPPVPGKPPFRVSVPTDGLADAIGAMRRMEK